MQDHDWDDLRYLLALYRAGKLVDAGRLLQTSETTVARRIKRLAAKLGTPLFVRTDTGQYEATDTGRTVATHAEKIENESIAIDELIGRQANQLTGTVRISAVPIIINRFLAPRLKGLRDQHPNLTLELVADSRNIDLSKREADMAIRFARPSHGGLASKTQKIGALAFGTFGPSADIDDDSLGWIGYDDAHANLPQERWLKSLMPHQQTICLRVSDAETALEATACGVGKAILPKAIGLADPRLRPIRLNKVAQRMERDVWLLSHKDLTARASVSAVKTWLTGLDWN